MKRIALLTLVLLAGCGGSRTSAPEPRLPAPLAARLATYADETARLAAAGDACGARRQALALTPENGEIAGGLAPDGASAEFGDQRFLLNPGSVGQPRDGDPRAAFLLLDLDARRAEFHRVGYPIEQTQREIADAGLPAILGQRLAHGQ